MALFKLLKVYCFILNIELTKLLIVYVVLRKSQAIKMSAHAVEVSSLLVLKLPNLETHI